MEVAMRELIVVVVVYMLANGLLLGLGIVIGFLLHWVFRGVDLGTGILIGVATTGMSWYFLMRIVTSISVFERERNEPAIPENPPESGEKWPWPPRKRPKK
jgi:hypothetical protein